MLSCPAAAFEDVDHRETDLSVADSELGKQTNGYVTFVCY